MRYAFASTIIFPLKLVLIAIIIPLGLLSLLLGGVDGAEGINGGLSGILLKTSRFFGGLVATLNQYSRDKKTVAWTFRGAVKFWYEGLRGADEVAKTDRFPILGLWSQAKAELPEDYDYRSKKYSYHNRYNRFARYIIARNQKGWGDGDTDYLTNTITEKDEE